MNIIPTDKKISSEDLFYMVCGARKEFSESLPRMNDFHSRVADELEGDYYESFVVQNPNKTETTFYWLTNEQCMLVGMRESKSVRRKVIEKIKALDAAQIPQTYAAALIEAGRLAQVAEEQAEQLAIAVPKVEFHDTVVNSNHTFSTRDAAKKINQRPIKFGEWLKGNGYLCLNGRAAQKYIDQGLFVTHTGVSDSKHSYTQTRMTSKGCAYFANKLFEIKL